MWVYLYICEYIEKYICGLKVGVPIICECTLYVGIYGSKFSSVGSNTNTTPQNCPSQALILDSGHGCSNSDVQKFSPVGLNTNIFPWNSPTQKQNSFIPLSTKWGTQEMAHRLQNPKWKGRPCGVCVGGSSQVFHVGTSCMCPKVKVFRRRFMIQLHKD